MSLKPVVLATRDCENWNGLGYMQMLVAVAEDQNSHYNPWIGQSVRLGSNDEEQLREDIVNILFVE